MYPVQLALRDFYHGALAFAGRDKTVQTDRLAGRVSYDAGGAYDQTPMCTPMVLGQKTTYSRWSEIENTGPDQWSIKELKISHSLFAKPVVLQTAVAKSEDEALSLAVDWNHQRQKERKCREVLTRPGDETYHQSSRSNGLDSALKLAHL